MIDIASILCLVFVHVHRPVIALPPPPSLSRRQDELESKLIEEETQKRVEELVAKRVAEELERRKDEIEAEVLRRVEEAKKVGTDGTESRDRESEGES